MHTIVGVAPQGFYGTFVGWRMNFWVPVSMEDTFEGGAYKLEDRGARWIESYARLKPGVTHAQAQQEFAAISGRLEAGQLKMKREWNWFFEGRTDTDGRFKIEGLLAGVKLGAYGNLFTNLTLQPGEVRDLGDVKINKIFE